MTEQHYQNLILCRQCGGVVAGKAVVQGRYVYHPDCLPKLSTYRVQRTTYAFADVEGADPVDAAIRARDLDTADFSLDPRTTSFRAINDDEKIGDVLDRVRRQD